MAKSKAKKTNEQDKSLDAIQAIDRLDLKECSFVQLQRLRAAMTQVAATVDEELKVRSEHDHEGDTVRVPVAAATD